MAIIGMGIGGAFLLSMMLSVPVATLLGLQGLFWLTAVFGLIGMLLVLTLPRTVVVAAETQAPAPVDMKPVWMLAMSVFLLHAVMTLLFVVLPRSLAALLMSRRATRLAGEVPLPLGEGWARRLLSPVSGGRARVDVQPCSVRTEPRQADRLSALLHDVFGTRAEVVLHDAVPYGDEPPPLPESDATQRCLVLLFGLSATPEAEVHGRLVSRCAAEVGSGAGAEAGPGEDDTEQRLLILVDGSGYADSVGRDSPRMAERRRAWDRVLREAGCGAAHIDLSADPGPGVLEALGAGLFPSALGAS